jgi:hypothetical protein
MLASDLTRAQSVSYERVHRLDQLSSFIPANLFESKSLTLKAAGRHRLTGIKVHNVALRDVRAVVRFGNLHEV